MEKEILYIIIFLCITNIIISSISLYKTKNNSNEGYNKNDCYNTCMSGCISYNNHQSDPNQCDYGCRNMCI